MGNDHDVDIVEDKSVFTCSQNYLEGSTYPFNVWNLNVTLPIYNLALTV